jgi:uncharacterized membrane protein
MAYTILVRVIVRSQGEHSRLRAAIGSDTKGYVSLVLYIVAILITFVRHELAWGFYALVALIWLVPDRRIERMV